jgi:hypothetical protein
MQKVSFTPIHKIKKGENGYKIEADKDKPKISFPSTSNDLYYIM